jgi:hypothetical protein
MNYRLGTPRIRTLRGSLERRHVLCTHEATIAELQSARGWRTPFHLGVLAALSCHSPRQIVPTDTDSFLIAEGTFAQDGMLVPELTRVHSHSQYYHTTFVVAVRAQTLVAR